MGALIDSSVLIAAERGALDLDGILNEHRETEFALKKLPPASSTLAVKKSHHGASPTSQRTDPVYRFAAKNNTVPDGNL